MRFANRSEAALYLWDYFYLSHGPAPGDEKAWGVIERAACRIRDTEYHLDARSPLDIRMRSARRMRSAVRTALKQIALLAAQPEPWVLRELAAFEALADATIRTLAESARQLVLD